MRQLKDNNSGLSLIELLVAMMILAVVVTPFLHSFFTTASANNKAKKVHRATTVAQNVMEGIRAEDLESIAAQFNYPDANWRITDASGINGGVNLSGSIKELEYDAGEGSYSDAVNGSAYSEDGGATVEFRPNGTGQYYYAIEGLQQDKGTYDVLVSLNSKSAEAEHYNSEALVQLPILDEERDAVCIEKVAYRENALAACDVTDLSDLRRTITINVDHTYFGGFGGERVRVLVTYKYENRTDSAKNFIKEITAFDSTEADAELRSVYLCYAPLYPAIADYDRIEYINNDNIPLNLYILKQKFDATDALAYKAIETTTSREEGYNMQLRLNSSAVTQWENSNTRLYSNLPTNLLSGNAVLHPYYSATFNGTENVNITADLTTSADDTRVFDLSVSVYEAATGTERFSNDKLLTTLYGSKLD